MNCILDLSVKTFQTNRNNNPLLPRSIRGCIIGKSGCGKTNLLVNLLLNQFGEHDWLDYDHLYIYGKSLHQPEYKIINTCFKSNNNKMETLKCIQNKRDPSRKFSPVINIEIFENDSDIKDPVEFDPNHKNLIIFDDVMLENQKTIESFYTRGRHNNIDCFYISQNYTKLPRHTIRENSNLFFIFQQDNITINNFYRDHCSDISKDQFKHLCKASWNEEYGFITIDLTKTKYSGKYRKGLNHYFIPK